MRKAQEGTKGSAAPLPSPPPKQRRLLPSSLCVPPGKLAWEERIYGHSLPASTAQGKKSEGESRTTERHVPKTLPCSFSPQTLPSVLHRSHSGGHFCPCWEPAASNEQFCLTRRQKQLKTKKGKAMTFFFPSPSLARKHIWQSPERWKPSARLPALQRLRGGGWVCASHRWRPGHCPHCPGVPRHSGGPPSPSRPCCCLQRALGRAGVP